MFVSTSLRAAALSLASAAIAASALTASVPANASPVAESSQAVVSVASSEAQQSQHRWRYYRTYEHRDSCHDKGSWKVDHGDWDRYECRRVRDRHDDHGHHKDYDYELWYRR